MRQNTRGLELYLGRTIWGLGKRASSRISPVRTHPGRAPGSRPGCPGAGRCRCRWARLGPEGRGRTQSGTPGRDRSCGNRAPRGPRSRRPAAPGKAAIHSAGSGYRGPGRGPRCGEGPRPRRPGCEPGFHLHRRRGMQTRGTTASKPQVLWEGTGEVRGGPDQPSGLGVARGWWLEVGVGGKCETHSKRGGKVGAGCNPRPAHSMSSHMMPSGVQELRGGAPNQERCHPPTPTPAPAPGLPLLALALQPAVPQGVEAGTVWAQGWAWGLRAGLALGLLLPALWSPRARRGGPAWGPGHGP